MRTCKPLPYGQLTTALVPTVSSPCFLRQSATVASLHDVTNVDKGPKTPNDTQKM